MKRGHNLPELSIDELPIPADVQIDRTWTAQMRDIARVVGPYATLLLVNRFGGIQLYVPVKPRTDHVIVRAIGRKAALALAEEYGNCRLVLPTARAAIARAKRAPIIAAVRRGEINATRAARILRSSRNYVAALANHGDEAHDSAPSQAIVPPPRQLDLLAVLQS